MELTQDQYDRVLGVNNGHIHEYLDLIDGDKQCCHGYFLTDDRMDDIQSVFESVGLHFQWSEAPKAPHHACRYFIAETESLLDQLTQAFQADHWEFGELLGFPDCCLDYYTGLRIGADAAIPAKIDAVETYPFYMNRFQRLDGRSLLSHFPCRYDCSKSLEIAQRRFNLLEKYDPERAATYETKLKSAVVYYHDHATLYAWDYERSGDTIMYDEFHTPVPPDDNEFVETVNEASELRVNNHQSITVDGETITEDDLAVAFFD